MQLEKNMYVRTKNGIIAKIISKEDVSGSLHREEIVFILDNGNKLALHSKKVVKASYYIIDLIEVGDYVNGKLVTEINKVCDINNCKYIECYCEMTGTSLCWCYYNKEIKSIVTKEQFEQMKYKVGE